MNAEPVSHEEIHTRRFWVSGRVQGVGFRFFVERCAETLKIRGWVRNLSDGRVEVVASGSPDALIRLETALHSGPPGARVDQVVRESVPGAVGLDSGSFEIRHA